MLPGQTPISPYMAVTSTLPAPLGGEGLWQITAAYRRCRLFFEASHAQRQTMTALPWLP